MKSDNSQEEKMTPLMTLLRNYEVTLLQDRLGYKNCNCPNIYKIHQIERLRFLSFSKIRNLISYFWRGKKCMRNSSFLGIEMSANNNSYDSPRTAK